MDIELTSVAADEIRRIVKEQELDDSALCLRVGVRGFGQTVAEGHRPRRRTLGGPRLHFL